MKIKPRPPLPVLGLALLAGCLSASAEEERIVIRPGVGMGPITIGMDWTAAKRIVNGGTLGNAGEQEEDLYGIVLKCERGVISDYAFYHDDPDSEPSPSTPGRVAYIGTSDKRFRMLLPDGSTVHVGDPIATVVKALGPPDGRRGQGMLWDRAGLEIEATRKGKGTLIGWIGVLPPKKR